MQPFGLSESIVVRNMPNLQNFVNLLDKPVMLVPQDFFVSYTCGDLNCEDKKFLPSVNCTLPLNVLILRDTSIQEDAFTVTKRIPGCTVSKFTKSPYNVMQQAIDVQFCIDLQREYEKSNGHKNKNLQAFCDKLASCDPETMLNSGNICWVFKGGKEASVFELRYK